MISRIDVQVSALGCDLHQPATAGSVGHAELWTQLGAVDGRPAEPALVGFDLPISSEAADLLGGLKALLGPGGWVTVGVLPESLWQRGGGDLLDGPTLALIGGRLGLVLLSHVDVQAIKGGRPFGRLGRYRDAGQARGFGVVAQSIEAAAWAVEHTPSHAVLLDGPTTQAMAEDVNASAAAGLVAAAREAEVALLGVGARTVEGVGATPMPDWCTAMLIPAGEVRRAAGVLIPKLGRPPEFA